VEALRATSPARFLQHPARLERYGLDGDCPVFPGMFDFCRLYAGASIEGAAKLNAGQYDVAVNWAGGLHHAKRAQASGFCYVNDCVLGIMELLRAHARVLYIDIDIHHGDGVEEAFYCSDRVMTLSLHLFRPEFFFPGTGALEEVGEGQGRGYAVNVPLLEGCTDADYLGMFKPILARVMEVFDPGAVVLQCGAPPSTRRSPPRGCPGLGVVSRTGARARRSALGAGGSTQSLTLTAASFALFVVVLLAAGADALVGDRLGALNLTLEGHAEAVAYVKSFNLPMLVLGGGGYTKTTVARAWTLDTGAHPALASRPRAPPRRRRRPALRPPLAGACPITQHARRAPRLVLTGVASPLPLSHPQPCCWAPP
jgi:acetoin utilization deacetylase AcuC-like enzyme